MKQSVSKFKKIGRLIEPILKVNMPEWKYRQNHIFSLWEEIVGEKISGKTKPDQFKTNRKTGGNILFIKLLGAYGPEISLQLENIKEKINLFYGTNFISRVHISTRLHTRTVNKSTVDTKEEVKLGNSYNNVGENLYSNQRLLSALTLLRKNLVKLEKKQ